MASKKQNPDAGDKAGGARGGDAGASERSGQTPVDLDFVRGLIEAVDSSGIDSLEITRAGTRVKISKTPPTVAQPQAMYGPPPQMHMAASGPQQAAPAPQASAAEQAPAEETGTAEERSAAAASAKGLVDVKSPMVGSFYRAPAPEAPPYVEVGTRVSKGQTLCIIEAMKLMNELESELEGVVREVLVDNADPVEYGQVLFRIDPNG